MNTASEHKTDVRLAPTFEAYCTCGWTSELEETPEGADALADEHDDSHARVVS